MTNKHAINKQLATHNSQLTKSAVLDYSGTHSLNAHTNSISNFNIRNRLSALTSFARQRLASLLSQNNSLNCFVRQSRKSAFTLAETLIVMGIIGVVAALTLPNLNSSTGNKEKIVKLQKIYSNLNDVYGRAVAVYGPIDTWYINASDTHKKTGERFADFLKLSKVCEGSVSGCFHKGEVYKRDNKSSGWKFDSSSTYKFLTADGSSVFFNIYRPLCNDFKATGNEDKNNVCGYIYVDIDGPNKGSYRWGEDMFEFLLTTDGIYPAGTLSHLNAIGQTIQKSCFEVGFYCTSWIFESGNIDYLNADKDGKCKNSDKTLSWSVLSCK
ncbi:type II secretion system protein [bacterium]|nr:type II secretion system protein [bacterium]